MKKINIKITEGACQDAAPCPPPPCGASAGKSMKNAHHGEEARMHRTTLAHLMADVRVLIDLVQDGDDLPEWLETKITKAGDYMSSAARYISGNVARDMGQLEEEIIQDIKSILSEYTLIEENDLYEELKDAMCEDGTLPCRQCLYETIKEGMCGCPDLLPEAKYKGNKVTLNKRLPGDVKKSKVYVKGCGKDKDRVKKINFGDKKMRIKKSNPKRRKSFRARHKCHTAKNKCTARYWSCKAW